MNLTVTAQNPTPSRYVPDRADARDISVTVVLDGVEVEGEATLLPDPHSGNYSSWGDPDHWLSGNVLKALESLSRRDEHLVMCEIAAVSGGLCD